MRQKNGFPQLFYCRFLLDFQDAFSLLAYSNPWSSPMGWQLCPSRREIVCAALNSAILGKLENKKKSEISRSSCQ